MDAPTKRVEILPAQRRVMILERVRRNGAATIQELADEIRASPSTIRRDLDHLTEEGYLERTHGGVLLVPPLRATFEREPSINALLQHDQKVAIGLAAAARLNPRDSVIFDSSSTVTEAVRAATLRDIPLTVVTNSLDIAQLCAACPTWRVIMSGGTIRQGSQMMVGEPGETFLKSIHVDICFVGAYAVTGRTLTDATLEVASLKRLMIQSARRTILLVDSSKFQAPAFSTFCDVSAVDEIITDDGIPAEHLAALRSLNVKVTVVPVTPSEA
ncbi:DeoR/GlpR family DNA-binding transcription regulator [Prosthecomicrobium pneumaticum]|uniref:DeoR/GlpR family transcriptional regulator of sugar metabolism n=1 Tax=Prosthecomicrobium pneumaticum TaxID=81895 RepID=A0A7W9CTD5_9HYPH|nr:DeoR/GlpR family DNA-binding transcription regulator [Prosthecomicrobium pneumaticum]MBB5751568.1 DeoR/GlpR family transcriptional regulator of sugar metabolism [Prosthecomicrobium pneumaticum]